jgi:hemerythrin-like domain-containing protein
MTPEPTGMDCDAAAIFAPFRADHARVLAQLTALERAMAGGDGGFDAASAAGMDALVRLLRSQFATHVAAEESVLYPALLEALPEAGPRLAPLSAEHHDMRAMLARLLELLEQPASPSRDEQLLVHARDLVDLLRIHITKEELAVFDVAARVLSATECERLVQRLSRLNRTTPESGASAGKGL